VLTARVFLRLPIFIYCLRSFEHAVGIKVPAHGILFLCPPVAFPILTRFRSLNEAALSFLVSVRTATFRSATPSSVADCFSFETFFYPKRFFFLFLDADNPPFDATIGSRTKTLASALQK